MKSKLNIFPATIMALVLIALATGCKGNDKDQDKANLPEEVKPVAIAILGDSPEEFASVVSYPLQRPYPLKDVEDSAEMVKYYPTLVDQPLKKAIKEKADSLWQQVGWRGWTLDSGNYLWIDESKIYEMEYLSQREKTMLDSLRNIEIGSLEPSMRKGWVPVMCVIDTIEGSVFRIDTENSIDPPVYRLAGYSADADLSGQPTILLYGTMEEEGSMSNRFFHFSDSTDVKADYSPDIVDDDSVPAIEMVRKGKTKKYPVKPGYWLDQIQRHADSLKTIKPDLADSPKVDSTK